MKHARIALAALALAAPLTATSAFAFDLPKIGLPSLLHGGSKDAPPAPSGAAAECPTVFIDNGASMVRVPPEADGASVRYQLTIDTSARECAIEGEQLTVKVGIEGGAVLGQQGAPGSYGANIAVALRHVKDNSLVSVKNYHVTATIPPGGARGDFRLIADPIQAPLMSPHPHNDYEIIVGFTKGAADAEKPAGKKKKGQR